MKIVFTSQGNTWDAKIDPRFGRTDYFVIYDEESRALDSLDNRAIAETAHGAGPQTAQKLLELEADILITGNGPGGNAARVLNQAEVRIYAGAGNMTVREALEAYRKGELKEL